MLDDAQAKPQNQNNLMSRALGEEHYSHIFDGLNIIFGVVSIIFALIQVYSFFEGSSSFAALAVMLLHIAANVFLSQLNVRYKKDTLRIDLFRFIVVNQLTALAGAYVIVGPLHPFWCLYFLNSLAIGPALFDITGRKWRIVCQLVNLSAFVAFYSSRLDSVVSSAEVVKIGLMIFTAASVSELYLEVLHSALIKLMRNAETIHKKQIEVEQKEKFLQGFIDHFPGLAYAKNNRGEFMLCNLAAKEVFGEDVIGKKTNDLINQNPFSNEQIHFATTQFNVMDEGVEIADCVIAIDVTDAINAEKDLELNRAKMIAASKMSSLGEMAGGVAHEINNPLAIIHGKAQRLNEFARSGAIDAAVVLKDTDKIMATVDRIARIVKALRSFSRDVAGTQFAKASVKEIISDSLELCAERFKAHQIHLDAPTIDERLTFDCRSVEICQILINLLNNAHDAVEGIEGSWIRLEVKETANTIEFTITDSGKGIPLELHDKILQPFFTTKPIGKGTGLGLSISIGLIESHHGKLTIDASSPNTRFVAIFPKVQSDSELEPQQIKIAA